jgi:hypothetical protein
MSLAFPQRPLGPASTERRMLHNITDFLQDEAWQHVAADVEELVREMVEQKGHTEFFGELKQRLVKLKLGHLKLRLVHLKQNLQQQLVMLEEELLADSDDDQVMYLLSQGTERLADMWLMESLLDRLSRSGSRYSDDAWQGGLLYGSTNQRARHNRNTSSCSN